MAASEQLIRHAPCFADLPPEVVAALAAIAAPLRRPGGAVLFLEGDPAPGMYLSISGRVKIARTSPSGREQVLRIAGPGEYFNLAPVFDGGPCPANASALDDVSLLLLPTEALWAATARYPALALALLAEACGHMRHLVGLVDTLALHTVQGRLARLLLAQAEQAAQGRPPAPLSQAEIAAQLGTVREMVSRTLKIFEGLGLVRIERGAITVLDRVGLEQQAEQ
jgi:CRP-like cAMP-binding protein